MSNAIASSSNLNLKMVSTTNNQENSEFIRFRATMRLPIPPIWASNGTSGGSLGSGGMEGVKEVLAGWVMRYLPPLRAVLLTFDSLPNFAHPTSTFNSTSSPFPPPHSSRHSHILTSDQSDNEEEEEDEPTTVQFKALPMIAGSGFTLALVEWQGLAWRPTVGSKITGSPTLSTPSHISLLIHNLFNASIPVSHIPSDTYHFDSDFEVPNSIRIRQTQNSWPSLVAPTEQVVDIEVEEEGEGEEEGEEGVEGEVEQEEIEKLVEEEEKASEAEEELYKERGWWRHNVTKEPLGGENCRLEFTIVSLTIANSMISITGSLLSDPFSPTNLETVPKPKRSNSVPLKKRQRAQSESSGSESDDDENDREEVEVPVKVVEAPPRVQSVGLDEEEGKSPKKKKDKSGKKEKKESKKEKKVKKE